ncbi:MAG: T9SS type A sorting domain-containing protein [Bacteroidetes bacterium]|nr:T9SS type A sorting domain-containing protein [Bacteroidota bacterium]
MKWLNEGWAVYNEHLFLEKFYGDSTYRKRVRDNHDLVLRKAHVDDDSYLPVSGVPSEYTYGTTVYKKGGDMIHTLRYYMGDSLFFHCVKNYLADFAFQNATTAQLRDYLSQCSGINLNDYFNDWIYAPGFSHFSIEWKQTLATTGSGLLVNMLIRQRSNHTTHFYNNVPVKISYFDTQWNRTDEVVNVSGECTSHSSLLSFEPVYIALDFDQKLQDAISDEWKIIRNQGSYDFGTARTIVNVNSVSDSSLLRVEYNWVRPEPMKNRIEGLHLHDKHYWTFDGINLENLSANVRFDYYGNDNSLDAPFISNSEDSIIMLYRANSDSDWVFVDSFSVSPGSNLNDKLGYVTVYNIRKGQYTFGIYNSAVTDTSTKEGDCQFNSIVEAKIGDKAFKLFPNPSTDMVTIAFERNIFNRASIYNLVGRRFIEQIILPDSDHFNWQLSDMENGSYLVTLTAISGNRFSKILIKQ